MAAAGLVLGLAVASPARAAFDPGVEAKNFSKTEERQAIYDTPAYQAQLRTQSNHNGLAALAAEAKDPEREFASDLCWNGNDGCAGDVRLYDWQKNHNGIVEPVLFTARNGATLSGHIWATKSGPASRPGIVITNGSVQADEQMYWYAAQALAKAGYVVMTWDPQGQGQSDTRGATPDENEGFPAQTDGRPFFDGTEDAVNFFYSTAAHPYVPETSCSTGTSHAAKQTRRVKAGLDAGYNPYWKLFDRKRLGLAGHSYGAAGVSYVGQLDPRVDAIVAWDNLCQATPGTGGGQGFPPGEQGCPAHPSERVDRTPALKAGHGKPALGMSADYFLPPTPNTTEPRPRANAPPSPRATSRASSPARTRAPTARRSPRSSTRKHGNDTGELVIRGGSHLDFSFIPNQAFGASLRGADMIDWYTTAWFDKYVKKDPSADRRLITNRWLADKQEAAVDPDHSGNMFSFYHRSRLDFQLDDGTRFDQEDLRSGKGLRADCDPANYSYLALATSPDTPRASHPCPSPATAREGRRALCQSAGCRQAHALRDGPPGPHADERAPLDQGQAGDPGRDRPLVRARRRQRPPRLRPLPRQARAHGAPASRRAQHEGRADVPQPARQAARRAAPQGRQASLVRRPRHKGPARLRDDREGPCCAGGHRRPALHARGEGAALVPARLPPLAPTAAAARSCRGCGARRARRRRRAPARAGTSRRSGPRARRRRRARRARRAARAVAIACVPSPRTPSALHRLEVGDRVDPLRARRRARPRGRRSRRRRCR